MSLGTKIRGLREVLSFDNRLWLALTKTLFRGENLHIYRYKGIDILADHRAGDANGFRDVLTSKMYRRFLEKMKFDAPINILDIGANTGGFPLLLFTSGLSLKKVVSIELHPETFLRLHFNLHHNLTCESIAVNAAVCGSSKNIEVKLGPGSVSESIYSNSDENGAKAYEIFGYSLDEIYSKYFQDEVIDVCKIDIEGAEFEIFVEPHHKSLQHCRYLIIEIHEQGSQTTDQLLPIITSLGFVHFPPSSDADQAVHFFENRRLQR